MLHNYFPNSKKCEKFYEMWIRIIIRRSACTIAQQVTMPTKRPAVRSFTCATTCWCLPSCARSVRLSVRSCWLATGGPRLTAPLPGDISKWIAIAIRLTTMRWFATRTRWSVCKLPRRRSPGMAWWIPTAVPGSSIIPRSVAGLWWATLLVSTGSRITLPSRRPETTCRAVSRIILNRTHDKSLTTIFAISRRKWILHIKANSSSRIKSNRLITRPRSFAMIIRIDLVIMSFRTTIIDPGSPISYRRPTRLLFLLLPPLPEDYIRLRSRQLIDLPHWLIASWIW